MDTKRKVVFAVILCILLVLLIFHLHSVVTKSQRKQVQVFLSRNNFNSLSTVCKVFRERDCDLCELPTGGGGGLHSAADRSCRLPLQGFQHHQVGQIVFVFIAQFPLKNIFQNGNRAGPFS